MNVLMHATDMTNFEWCLAWENSFASGDSSRILSYIYLTAGLWLLGFKVLRTQALLGSQVELETKYIFPWRLYGLELACP